MESWERREKDDQTEGEFCGGEVYRSHIMKEKEWNNKGKVFFGGENIRYKIQAVTYSGQTCSVPWRTWLVNCCIRLIMLRLYVLCSVCLIYTTYWWTQDSKMVQLMIKRQRIHGSIPNKTSPLPGASVSSGPEIHQWFLVSADIKNEWSCVSISPYPLWLIQEKNLLLFIYAVSI